MSEEEKHVGRTGTLEGGYGANVAGVEDGKGLEPLRYTEERGMSVDESCGVLAVKRRR